MLLLLAGCSSAEPASSWEHNSKIKQFFEKLYFFKQGINTRRTLWPGPHIEVCVPLKTIMKRFGT
jgi:hypothetical protein